MSHRWSRSCVALAFFIPSFLFSQVTIRERLELKRQILPPQLQSASVDSFFLVRVEWDINYPTTQVRLTSEYDSFCNEPMWQLVEEGTQYQVYRIEYSPSGTYGLAIWHYGWPDPVHVTVRVFKASEPERTFSLTIGPYGGYGTPPSGSVELGDFWGTPFTTRFYRCFNMNVWKGEIFPSDENFFWLTNRIDTCSRIQWYPSADSVTLAITAGSDLGQFVSQTGVPLGSSVTRLASAISYTKFVADTGNSAGGTVTVRATSKGLSAERTFRVLPFLGRSLRLEATQPIIPFGRDGGFRVEVLDSAGGVVPVPANVTFTYEILEGAQWGTLFDYDTWQSGSVVDGAPSVIDFLTTDTAPYDDKRVVVRVSSSNTTLTPDTAEVLILPGLLKVSVSPTTLQYGQSAEIVAEGLYQNGELAPLDPSVLYSYEIVQAADAGYLAEGTDATHGDLISDVGPTATFVAEEEVPQPASVEVIIKVTARQEVIWAKVDTSGGTPVSPPVVTPVLKKRMARTQQYVEDIGVARLVVRKKSCEDAPHCAVPGVPPPPSFTVVPRPDGYNGNYLDVCNTDRNAQGAFSPMIVENTLSTEPYTVDACFDNVDKKWRFRVSAPIQVNALLDICENNIPGWARRVYELSDIDEYDKCTVARKDLENRRLYRAPYSKYIFIQVLLMHEQMHMWDFQTKLLQRLASLVQILARVQNTPCEQFADIETARREGEKLVKKAVNAFLRDGTNNWLANRMTEQMIHSSVPVQGLISDLLNQLNCSN